MRNLLLFHARLSLQFVQVSTLAGIFVQAAEEVSDHVVPPHVGFFKGSACFDTTVRRVTTIDKGSTVDLLVATGKKDVQVLQCIRQLESQDANAAERVSNGASQSGSLSSAAVAQLRVINSSQTSIIAKC